MECNRCAAASPELNSLIETIIVEYVEGWSRSRKYDKYNSKLSGCLSFVHAELSNATKDRTKWKKDSIRIDKFSSIIPDKDEKKHPLYAKIQQSPTWKKFAKERAMERKEILREAKLQNICTRTPLKRRNLSDIREELTNGNVFDETSVVKSKRVFTERQRIRRKEQFTESNTSLTAIATTAFATAPLDGLKDS
eukprot:CAMPEP_0174994874 /NCGR_PEP_ID=MMETSP0004_2-20121128/23880_1 /TAXON_ID=420556 /ORGANISM="Ochromonas sp., Strain CCMP1393" /LENGTH=193 /DNA_ID=CAMNT_0016249163 /DNA_START=117 /DNA_END=698 /DNA_ORIENTATION=+